MMNPIAILLYGALTLLLTATLALQSQSRLALALAVVASGATYLFQVMQENDDISSKVLAFIWAIVVILTVGSVLVSLGA